MYNSQFAIDNRQLLTGVENLRLIASTIESLSQYNPTNVDTSLSDDTDDNEGRSR